MKSATSRLSFLLGALLAGVPIAGVSLMGCAATQAMTRQDLQDALFKHHLELKWERTANAGRFVHPDLREEFVQKWTTGTGPVDVNTIDMVNLVEDEKDGLKSATVTLLITWVDRNTMSVRESMVEERWVHGDDGWLLEKPIFPEDILAAGKSPSMSGNTGLN